MKLPAAPATAYVGLGANLGEPRTALESALGALAGLEDTVLAAVSSAYRSAPVDAQGPEFLNAVARLETGLDPARLLAELQRIELDHGRERPYRNAPRSLDLDLLLYGEQRLDSDVLTLPHPRLHERAFVLQPLLELAPDLRVTGLGRLADQLPSTAGQEIRREEQALQWQRRE